MAIRFPAKRGPRGQKFRNGAKGSRFENGVKIQLESQGVFDADKHKTKIPYTEEHKYIPDFILPNGIIIEAKGYFPSEDRTKMRAVKKTNPGLDIRIVFQNAKARLNKDSKTTYADWADKNGFVWSDRVVPVEWIYERKEVNTTEKD